MDKKIAKIGMIMVLTLALILSSVGVLGFPDIFSNEFNEGANQTAVQGGDFSPENDKTLDENSFFNNDKITAQAATPPVWNGGISGSLRGSGSSSDPYLISNGDDLAYLAQQTNSIKDRGVFKLTADIDLGKHPWTPIGKNADYCFYGWFDGDGHTISGININSSGSHVGLFGYTSILAEIMNLGITDSTIIGANNTGGIVGYNVGKIYNCYTSNSVYVYGGDYSQTVSTGGIVGLNHEFGLVRNCYNLGTVSGVGSGGVVGHNNKGSVKNCYSLADRGVIIGAMSYTGGTYESLGSFNSNGELTPVGGTSIVNGRTTLRDALNDFANKNTGKYKTWVNVIGGHPIYAREVAIKDATKNTVTYDGKEQKLEFEGPDKNLAGFIVYYKRIDQSDAFYVKDFPTAVGTYNVKITRPEDARIEITEDDPKTGVLVIDPADVTLEWTPPPTGLVYDGNVKVPEVKIASGIVGKDPCPVTAALTTSNNNVDVGEFTYTATISNANYKINTSSEISPKYAIAPKKITNIKVERERDGTTFFNHKLTVVDCDEFIDGDDVTITFNTESPDLGIYKGSDGKITDFNISGTDSGNYTFGLVDVTAEITKLRLPDINAMGEVEYNSNPQTPTVTFVKDVEPTNYELSWGFKAPGGTEFVPVTGTPEFHDAGEYKLTATGINNYYLVKTAIYTIKQKPVVLTWQTAGDIVYTGKQIIPTIEFAPDDIIAGDECEIIYGLTSGDNLNVGSPFKFTATELSNINYAFNAPLDSGTFTITKATDNFWTTPLSIVNIYKGGKLEPIAVSKYGADTIIIRYYDSNTDGTIGVEIPTPDTKKTGTYFVSAEVPETTSYNGLAETSVQFRIKTRPIEDGPVTSITQNDVFWTGVIIDLINKDDTILKRECDFGTMPKNVLETIRDTDKTLDIEMMGENLYITSEKLKDLIFDKDEYTIEEIKAMLADKPKPTPTPEPVEPTPPEPACSVCGMCPTFLGICLWIWLAIVVTTTTIIVIIIVVDKKKKEDIDNIDDLDDQK